MLQLRSTLCASVLLLLSLSAALSPALANTDTASEGRTFLSGGESIYYTVAGEGEPVVLVHGFSADGTQNWGQSGVSGLLDDEFQVITIDNRGHGKSAKPHDPAEYGVQMAIDVVALLDHLDLDKAHVVGYSMGGFITVRLLAIAPERLLSATVAGAGWMPPELGDLGQMELAESLEAGNGITPLIVALTPEGQEPPSQEQLDFLNKMVMQTNDPLALAAVIRGMETLAPSKSQLEANVVPTLAIVGAEDPLAEAAKILAETMPETTLQLIDGADHMTAVPHPELRQGILDFLRSTCQCGG